MNSKQLLKVGLISMLITFAVSAKTVLASDPCFVKVSSTGSAQTRAEVFDSIQTAIDSVIFGRADCTVWVGPGVYEEDVVIQYQHSQGVKSITLSGVQMDRTVIKGSIIVLFPEFDPFADDPAKSGKLTIKNLTLDGESQRSIGLEVLNMTESFVFPPIFNRILLENIRVHHYTNTGIFVDHLFRPIEVYGSVIDHNLDGLVTASIPQGTARLMFVNNTVADNTRFGVHLPSFGGHPTGNFVNNVFFQNQYAIGGGSSGGFFSEYNNFYGNEQNLGTFSTGEETTNIFEEHPQFRSPENGNYHLSSTSPNINTGDPLAARDPNGSRSDRGALPFLNRRVRSEYTTVDEDPRLMSYSTSLTGDNF